MMNDTRRLHQRYNNDRADGSAFNIVKHVLLDATLISNVMIFGQAYVKGVAGQTSGADRAGSARERDNGISSFYSLFVLVVGSFDASRLSSFATVQPA
jgi:hypothetical protein